MTGNINEWIQHECDWRPSESIISFDLIFKNIVPSPFGTLNRVLKIVHE